MSNSELPADYDERVYAGVLGKIIGVYLGRPVEGWLNERIERELGDIDYYVHDRVGVPLIVVDDDISGTFAFLEALPDNGNTLAITPAMVAETWMNCLIEEKNILWWGGMGNSTEHTAFLRLKDGVAAPLSGSAQLNGPVVAEQIGAQIFIDGFAMVLPGQPSKAAELAAQAARVSHDGEAVFAAQALVAMEAQAFLTADINELLDTALSVIPADSTIAQLIRDIRSWHAAEPDWRRGFALLEAKYGYHTYGGNVHVVPNHGLIILALLYGAGSWDTSMMIVNTAGWDTDCNSGNLGCLLGIMLGLDAFTSARDWRGPVADRMLVPTAEGGRCVTDAVREAVIVSGIGRAIAGQPLWNPKGGARFHFSFPGSVQGFEIRRGVGKLSNVPDARPVTGAVAESSRVLRLSYSPEGGEFVASTSTFIPPELLNQPGYGLIASPTLYSGQEITAALAAPSSNTVSVAAKIVIARYEASDELVMVEGPSVVVEPGQSISTSWVVPGLGSDPIAYVGIVVDAAKAADLDLDWLGWTGDPLLELTRASPNANVWRRAWVNSMDGFTEGWGPGWPEPMRLIQNTGRGYISQGTRDWTDLEVAATLTPHMARSTGLAVRYQGLRRHYLLRWADDSSLSLIRVKNGETVLGAAPLPWTLYEPQLLAVRIVGSRLTVTVGGKQLLSVDDAGGGLDDGGVAVMCEAGRIGLDAVRVVGGRHLTGAESQT